MIQAKQVIEGLISNAGRNPDSARSLRNAIVSSMNMHRDGTEARSQFLGALNDLDNYVAANGHGYRSETWN